jgi:hypothetical protein
MKFQVNFKSAFIESVVLLYVLLFVYAAVSKLLDFERFQVQLAQSPILSAYAYWISYLVIGIELFVSILLLFARTRIIGLFAALTLMTMFTVYIFIVLHYSSFIPCSCGGILEKMTWKTHLVFNMVFILLAAAAIMLQNIIFHDRINSMKNMTKVRYMVYSLLSGTILVILLFLSSEEIIHHKNPFIRRYPKRAVVLNKTIDLKFNSYYFAGYVNKNIYLANYTDPLHLLSIDTLGNQKRIKLYFEHRQLPFKAIKIILQDNYVYLLDGTVPCIYRGDIKDWKITARLGDVPRFTLGQPIDSVTIAIRNNTGKDKANILGIYHAESGKVHYTPKLLRRQIDGIFDTDGMLLYDQQKSILLYSYFYRNQFFTADKNGLLKSRGNTIDTNTQAKIKVAYLKNNTERQMAAPPLKVNALSAVRNNLLFINSKVPGRFEDDKFWKKSSVIDVYNLEKNSYVLSFYIQEIPNQKIQNLFVTDKHLYVTAGSNLMLYDLGHLIENEIK